MSKVCMVFSNGELIECNIMCQGSSFSRQFSAGNPLKIYLEKKCKIFPIKAADLLEMSTLYISTGNQSNTGLSLGHNSQW